MFEFLAQMKSKLVFRFSKLSNLEILNLIQSVTGVPRDAIVLNQYY